MTKNKYNLSLMTILILALVSCCAVFFLYFALFPVDSAHGDNSASIPVNEITSRRTTSGGLNNRQRYSPVVELTRTTDNNNSISAISHTDAERLEEDKRLESLPFDLDSVVMRNGDGTSTITEDVELEFGGGVVFHFPQGTLIESDDVIRVGAQGAQVVDADGNIETFLPGHAIGFSYYDEDTSSEVGSFDILHAIEGQESKKKTDSGCNNTGAVMPQMLVLLLFLGKNKLRG